MFQTVGGGFENDDGDFAACQILLIAKVRVQGNQNIKATSAKLKSSPFFFPAHPTSFTVWHSWPRSTKSFLSVLGVHSSSRTFILAGRQGSDELLRWLPPPVRD